MKGGQRKRREARAQRREARDRPASSRGQAGPRAPASTKPPPRPSPGPHGARPVPVRPAGMRCGVRAARPSRRAASAAREPGSRFGLWLPATPARSFFQRHGELAEGVEERAEAAGQAQHHDAQVAPHRAGPAPPLPPPPPPPAGANWNRGSRTAQPRAQQVPPPPRPRARPPACPPPSRARPQPAPKSGHRLRRRGPLPRGRAAAGRAGALSARGRLPGRGALERRGPGETPTREQVIPEPGALNCRG